MYYFKHLIGCFIIKDQSVTDELLSQDPQEQDSFCQKYPKATPLPKEQTTLVLTYLKDPRFHPLLREANTTLTIQAIKDSVNQSQLIIQTISNVRDLEKTTNLLSKRLREWASLTIPEVVEKLHDHQKLAELISLTSIEDLKDQFEITITMGADLTKKDQNQIRRLATQIDALYTLRVQHIAYLEHLMQDYCPNLEHLAGTTLAASLIEMAKGLKNLATMPASTIQLLGAEKALFRHLKTGARSPKYGIIINHPIIAKAKRPLRGKASRQLADKLSLCSRIDFFKGEFKADQYRKKLEEKYIHG